jgi:hypothetical protein
MRNDALLSDRAAVAVMDGDGLGDNAIIAILRSIDWRIMDGGRYVLHSTLNRLMRSHGAGEA